MILLISWQLLTFWTTLYIKEQIYIRSKNTKL